MPLLSRSHVPRRGKSFVDGEFSAPRSLHRPPQLPQLETRSSPTPELNGTSLSQHYVEIVQDLRSSLPPACRWLGPADLDLVGERPFAAGGFADIYEAAQGGRKVVLKSYRYYLSFDVAEVVSVSYSHNLH